MQTLRTWGTVRNQPDNRVSHLKTTLTLESPDKSTWIFQSLQAGSTISNAGSYSKSITISLNKAMS